MVSQVAPASVLLNSRALPLEAPVTYRFDESPGSTATDEREKAVASGGQMRLHVAPLSTLFSRPELRMYRVDGLFGSGVRVPVDVVIAVQLSAASVLLKMPLGVVAYSSPVAG